MSPHLRAQQTRKVASLSRIILKTLGFWGSLQNSFGAPTRRPREGMWAVAWSWAPDWAWAECERRPRWKTPPGALFCHFRTKCGPDPSLLRDTLATATGSTGATAKCAFVIALVLFSRPNQSAHRMRIGLLRPRRRGGPGCLRRRCCPRQHRPAPDVSKTATKELSLVCMCVLSKYLYLFYMSESLPFWACVKEKPKGKPVLKPTHVRLL